MHPWNAGILESIRRRSASLPHALLLHGPKGVGKLQLAERIAQMLLCEAEQPSSRPCGACEGCRWYLGGNHPDFRRVEPEALAAQPEAAEGEEGEAPPVPSAKKGKPSQDIRVDQIRELADFLNVMSHRAGRRIALVHPAEEMNANAANALLKALEEPPGGAMFILVSHRPARLLPTIRSRCVAVPVPVPSLEAARQWLQGEGVKDADRWLAYAGGAPLRALEYRDNAETVERLLKAIRSGAQIVVDDRQELEALAEALQKYALDRALAASGLVEIFATGAAGGPGQARDWLRYAREMGRNRALARHPLNTRLFAAEMLAAMPRTGR